MFPKAHCLMSMINACLSLFCILLISMDIDKLYKMQKRAARAITGSKYDVYRNQLKTFTRKHDNNITFESIA